MWKRATNRTKSIGCKCIWDSMSCYDSLIVVANGLSASGQQCFYAVGQNHSRLRARTVKTCLMSLLCICVCASVCVQLLEKNINLINWNTANDNGFLWKFQLFELFQRNEQNCRLMKKESLIFALIYYDFIMVFSLAKALCSLLQKIYPNDSLLLHTPVTFRPLITFNL